MLAQIGRSRRGWRDVALRCRRRFGDGVPDPISHGAILYWRPVLPDSAPSAAPASAAGGTAAARRGHPRPHLIAIAGASGSGKTTLAQHLADALGVGRDAVIPIDAYYHDHPDYGAAEHAAANYDAPDAIDIVLLRTHLDALREGQPVERPVYDFRRRRRAPATATVRPAPILLLEGLLALHWPEIRALAGTRVFIRIDAATALARRLARDRAERGRDEASVRQQWVSTVWPSYERWVARTARFADVAVDGALPIATAAAAVLDHVRPSVAAARAPRSRSKTRAN